MPLSLGPGPRTEALEDKCLTIKGHCKELGLNPLPMPVESLIVLVNAYWCLCIYDHVFMCTPACMHVCVYLSLTFKSGGHLPLGHCCLGKVLQKPGCSWFDSWVNILWPLFLSLHSFPLTFHYVNPHHGPFQCWKIQGFSKSGWKFSMDLMI